MATQYSTEMTNLVAVPQVPLSVADLHGKVRIATVTANNLTAAASAGEVIQLCKLPAGRVRLIGGMSQLYINLTTASMTLDIGWAAYTDLDGAAVAADPDGLDDGLDVDTAGVFAVGSVAAVLAAGRNKLFESQAGVIITATAMDAVVANDDICGHIAYVLD